jgi:hypothetical protein
MCWRRIEIDRVVLKTNVKKCKKMGMAPFMNVQWTCGEMRLKGMVDRNVLRILR